VIFLQARLVNVRLVPKGPKRGCLAANGRAGNAVLFRLAP
jgi:hypothetical protein